MEDWPLVIDHWSKFPFRARKEKEKKKRENGGKIKGKREKKKKEKEEEEKGGKMRAPHQRILMKKDIMPQNLRGGNTPCPS